MQRSMFPVRPTPPPVTKVVTVFRGTEDETRVEFTVEGRGRRRRVVKIRRLPRE